MLHKPLGYVTTMKDDHAHRIVADLVPLDRYPSLFPLGRLDRDTTGLLLFSTDANWGTRFCVRAGHVVKRYLALVEGTLTQGQAGRLARRRHAGRRPHAAGRGAGAAGPGEAACPGDAGDASPARQEGVPRVRARVVAPRRRPRGRAGGHPRRPQPAGAPHAGRGGAPRGGAAPPVVRAFGPGRSAAREWRLLAAEEAAALGEAVAKD